jgi:protocatechuate 3,4-dioxygenase beta subunit
MNLHTLLIAAMLLALAPRPSAALPSTAPPKPDKGPGCGVTTRAPTVSITASGTISGRVFTALKTPLSSGEVWICQIPVSGGPGKVVRTDTGPDGSYAFSGLEAGGYQLTFVDPTEKYAYQYWNTSGENAPSGSYASTVVLDDGQAVTGINRILPTAGRITGTIRNKRGEGLPDVRVRIDIQDLSGLYETTPISPALSGPDGTYAAGGLPTSDRYRLTITDPQGRYHPATLRASVTAGSVSAGMDVTLPQAGGDVVGRVTDGQGGPLADILVTPYQSDRAGVWRPLPAEAASTDSAGAYQLFNLPPGIYRLGFSDPSGRAAPEFYPDAPAPDGAADLSVQAERTLSGIDAVLTVYHRIYLPLVQRG